VRVGLESFNFDVIVVDDDRLIHLFGGFTSSLDMVVVVWFFIRLVRVSITFLKSITFLVATT
jgi:hypothetical protein